MQHSKLLRLILSAQFANSQRIRAPYEEHAYCVLVHNNSHTIDPKIPFAII